MTGKCMHFTWKQAYSDINNMPKEITAWWMRGYNADSFAFIVGWQFHSCQLFAKSLEWRTSRGTWSNVGCFRALWLRNQESFLETRTRISEQKLMTQLKEDARQFVNTVVDFCRMLTWGDAMSVSTTSSVSLLRFPMLLVVTWWDSGVFCFLPLWGTPSEISSLSFSTCSESALSVFKKKNPFSKRHSP